MTKPNMIVRSEEQYRDVIAKALAAKLVSIDSEGEAFDKKAGKTHAFDLALDGIGVFGEGVRAYIPARFLDSQFQRVLNECEVIFHNAKFDLTMIEKEGLDISKLKFHDTMIMSWMLDENRRSFGLKNLAKTILKQKIDDVTEFKDVGDRPTREGLGLFANEYDDRHEKWETALGEYCIDDCKYTYRLFKLFEPQMKEQNLWKVYTELEIPTILVLRAMENRGIMVDESYLKNLGENVEKKLIEIRADIWKDVGKEFDINSSQQLSKILFDEMKLVLPDEYKTDAGKWSTDVNSLKYLSEHANCELAKKVLEFRMFSKLHGTYVVGLLERAKNGIIHGSFLQHGTVTGRLSSSNPNMQNFPRRADEYDIRKAFVARPGYTFVIADLSQIEFRLLAYFSKDPTLLAAYQADKDMHQATADALGCTRNLAKTVNFGLAYGRTAYGMSHSMGMSADEAQRFIDTYFEKFAKLKVFFNQALNFMKKNHYVNTICKRRRRFPEYLAAKRNGDKKGAAHCERQTVNAIIQGSAADLMKVQMRNVHEKLKPFDAHILVQIHDEIIVEVPEVHSELVKEIVKYEMENAMTLPGVPIKTEPEISPRWKK